MCDFIKKFIEFLNQQGIMDFYSDNASKTAVYPYTVLSNPYEQNLRYGTQLLLDMFIWADNSIKSEILEEKVQQIKNICDGKVFTDIPAIVYCDDIRSIDDPDYEKVKKKISLIIRIM